MPVASPGSILSIDIYSSCIFKCDVLVVVVCLVYRLSCSHAGRHSAVMLQADGINEAERQAQQDRVNPAYVPRNHVMQDAVKLADQGDYSEVPCRLYPTPS